MDVTFTENQPFTNPHLQGESLSLVITPIGVDTSKPKNEDEKKGSIVTMPL